MWVLCVFQVSFCGSSLVVSTGVGSIVVDCGVREKTNKMQQLDVYF